MGEKPRKHTQHDEDVATKRRPKVKRPRRYKVLFHNDNYTTMDFVVLVLMRFFGKDETEATHIMLTVHHRGHAVAGVYTRDIAETKVAQVSKFAQDSGFPLKLTAEPE